MGKKKAASRPTPTPAETASPKKTSPEAHEQSPGQNESSPASAEVESMNEGQPEQESSTQLDDDGVASEAESDVAQEQTEPLGPEESQGQNSSALADDNHQYANDEFSDRVATITAAAIAVFFFAAIVWGAYQVFSGGASELAVAAPQVSTRGTVKKISARIELDRVPVDGAHVWVQAFDATGSLLIVQADDTADSRSERATASETEDGGYFSLRVADGAAFVQVGASLRRWYWWRSKHTDQIIKINPKVPISKDVYPNQKTAGNVTAGIFILLWFMASVLWAIMVNPKDANGARGKYYAAVLMAFLFPVFVAGAFGVAQSRFVSTANADKVISLGVATVFKGSYVEGLDDQWVLSMTLPSLSDPPTVTPEPSVDSVVVETDVTGQAKSRGTDSTVNSSTQSKPLSQEPDAGDSVPLGEQTKNEGSDNATELPNGTNVVLESSDVIDSRPTAKAEEPSVMKGFGAPIWVLFVSVIGAGLSTIALLVGEIADPPDFNNVKKLQMRIHTFVEHEFYILFAPVGGMFVYQLMVLSNAANEWVTVAMAALGAGVSINAILAQAIASSRRVASGGSHNIQNPPPGGRGPGGTNPGGSNPSGGGSNPSNPASS